MSASPLQPFRVAHRARRLLAVIGAAVALAHASAQPVLRDIETLSRAELEQVSGIGVAMAERLLQERERAPFADWSDLMRRVPGLKRTLATRLSASGMRIRGEPFVP